MIILLLCYARRLPGPGVYKMLRKAHILILAAFFILLCGCGKEKAARGKPLAKVNDYTILEKDFCEELSCSAYLHDINGLTLEEKKRFLNDQIRKELLIEKAVQLGIDQEDDFRLSIEKYWEQTLIAALLKKQCAQLEKGILVTEEEIQNRYHQTAGTNALWPPPEEVMSALAREIREEKKTQAMDDWITGLSQNAMITIYEENLEALR